MNTLALLAMAPIVTVGGPLTSWLISLAIIVGIVLLIIWLVTKFAGPPSIPEPFRWVIWLVVAIALLLFVFAAFGVRLP